MITFDNGKSIQIIYDAAGNKLRKLTSDGVQIDYLGGIEYKNQTLESIAHSEGRVTTSVKQPGKMIYEYTIKDHLGNSRVMFSDLNEDGKLTIGGEDSEILQESHYYPFGMQMEGNWVPQVGVKNEYLYNGKELNSDFDLNWLDYGARWYDPSIARWNAVDPLAEATYSLTPYHYTMNNPISKIDPNGMLSQSFIDNIWNGSGSGSTTWTNNDDGTFSDGKGNSVNSGGWTINQMLEKARGSEVIQNLEKAANNKGLKHVIQDNRRANIFGISGRNINGELTIGISGSLSLDDAVATYAWELQNIINDDNFNNIHKFAERGGYDNAEEYAESIIRTESMASASAAQVITDLNLNVSRKITGGQYSVGMGHTPKTFKRIRKFEKKYGKIPVGIVYGQHPITNRRRYKKAKRVIQSIQLNQNRGLKSLYIKQYKDNGY